MDESSYISPSLLRLADQFRSLPGIGRPMMKFLCSFGMKLHAQMR